MTMFRYAVSALAAAGAVYAQGQCGGTTTIQSSGDATAIGACPTWSGDIVVATSTTDNIDLGGIQQIKGNLVVNNVTQMSQLSGGNLNTIGGRLQLISVTVLTDLSFPKLTQVDFIDFNHIGELNNLNFGMPGVTLSQEVDIADTGLQSLNGIDLTMCDNINLNQNRQLSQINLQLINVTGAIGIAGNGRNLSVNLPNLEWAKNITMQNVTNLELPSLQFTNTTLGFLGNDIQSLVLPNLTQSGALTISDNEQLSNVTIGGVTTINGGVNILNNPSLLTVNGFPNLATITGAVDMTGNFTDVEFPALHLVRGAFNVQSTGDIGQNCTVFKGQSGANNVIEGHFVCAGSQATPGGAGTTPQATGSGKKSAAGRLHVSNGAVVGIAVVLAAMPGML